MRRILTLTFGLLAVATTAVAATRNVVVPTLLAPQIKALHAKGIGPILLPQTLPTGVRHLYPTADAAAGGYELDLGAAKGCHGANACFVAEFSARHGAPFNTVKVSLSHGITGYFKTLTCGGSCSPPSIEFTQSGFVYTIQANVGRRSTEKPVLTRMADSAIDHGAR